jgi:hypothetical protein
VGFPQRNALKRKEYKTMTQQFPRRPAAGTGNATEGTSLPSRRTGTALAALRVAIIAIATAGAPLAHAENFKPPDMEGFSLDSERDADGDGDGVNETHIMHYMNANGDSLFSMTTNGRTWAWSLDTRGSDTGPSNYVIRDSDCDGSFDEVYGLDEEFHVPDCVE